MKANNHRIITTNTTKDNSAVIILSHEIRKDINIEYITHQKIYNIIFYVYLLILHQPYLYLSYSDQQIYPLHHDQLLALRVSHQL